MWFTANFFQFAAIFPDSTATFLGSLSTFFARQRFFQASRLYFSRPETVSLFRIKHQVIPTTPLGPVIYISESKQKKNKKVKKLKTCNVRKVAHDLSNLPIDL